MGLSCLNCGADTEPADAKFIGGAFACPTCHTLAQRLLERGTKILDSLKLAQLDAIRLAFIEGRLHFGSDDVEKMSQHELLDIIGALVEKMNASEDPPGMVRTAGQPESVSGNSAPVRGGS